MPMRMGLIRNHYVGRTFIEPAQSIRHFGVKVKLNPVRSLLEGQRVVLIDDSIVRGTTSRKIVKMVRAAGAAEVHVRISCPPTISPCFYGVDTPQRSELIAATHSIDEIRKYLDADSVGLSQPRGPARRRSRPTAAVTAPRATPGGIRWRSRATSRPTCSWRSSSTAAARRSRRLSRWHERHRLQVGRRRHRRRQRDRPPHQVDCALARSRRACCPRSGPSAGSSAATAAAGPTRCSSRAPTASAPS